MGTTLGERLLKPEEVAELLAVTPKSIRQWLREGRLRGIRAGRLWRVRPEDLDEFIHVHATVKIPGPEPAEPAAEHDDRSWLDTDASRLGEFEPYEWAEGELEKGRPVAYEPGKGFVVGGADDGE